MAIENVSIGEVSFEYFLLALVVIALSFILSNFVYDLLRNVLDKKSSRKVSKWFSRIAQYFILLGGFYLVIFKILSLDLTALLTSLGIIGLIIAFSSQQLIQNAISGILIIFQRPIELEDLIEVGFPTSGINKVKDIRLTRTFLEDSAGRIIIVPNSLILSSKVVNYTKLKFSEISIPLKVSIKDIEKVTNIILQALSSNQRILPNVGIKEKSLIKRIILKDIRGRDYKSLVPRVLISEIQEDFAIINIRAWIIEVLKKDEIVSEILKQITQEFKKEKIWKF